MSSPESVSADEALARFVFFSKWVRADGTMRPEAFIPRPPPHLDLSMFRHIGLTEWELWQIGQSIATTREITFYGKAVVSARAFFRHSLRGIPTPPKNHVNIVDWPSDKPAQKMIALEIAAASRYVSTPIVSP